MPAENSMGRPDNPISSYTFRKLSFDWNVFEYNRPEGLFEIRISLKVHVSNVRSPGKTVWQNVRYFDLEVTFSTEVDTTIPT
jgi:hypothetical protein